MATANATIAFVKLILVVTNSGEKSFVFVTDDLRAHSLKEAITMAIKGVLELAHVVQAKIGTYLRSHPNATSDDNLDTRSVTAYRIVKAIDALDSIVFYPAFQTYWKLRNAYLRRLQKQGRKIIIVDGYLATPKDLAVETLLQHRKHIFAAAKLFSIDSYTLGAIMIDEYARLSMLDVLTDEVLLTLHNPSVGIAQVTIETARGLIKQGYYNPNPDDKELSEKNIDKTSREHLYAYIVQPKHNVHFAAAKIRERINFWSPRIDISKRPDMIQYAYARGEKVTLEQLKKLDKRARQTRREFYPLAKRILGHK